MTLSQLLTIATWGFLLLLASYVAGYIHLLGSME
jgi:hypothetical protein